jgi:predicted TIM-barrel fold metal-dependent hydrolase
MDEAFFILRRHRNVYLELSGIPPRKILEYFPRLQEVGDRVVWGTDWPSPGVKDLRRNLEQFLTLDLPDDLKDRITRHTALSLFPVR